MPTSQRNSVKPPAAERNKIKRFSNFTAGNFTLFVYDLPLNYSSSPSLLQEHKTDSSGRLWTK